eukprot:gene16539-18868_t
MTGDGSSGDICLPKVTNHALDNDFTAARWRRCQAATGRIIATAEEGVHLAEAYLSILYDRDNTLVGKDRVNSERYATKALPWLNRNSSNGNAVALYLLALCYLDGRGVGENKEEASRYCQLAVNQAGNHLAEAYLSILYNNIDTLLGLDQAQANIFVAKSLPWLQESADNGNVFAIFNL